jgi:hypothetical protein
MTKEKQRNKIEQLKDALASKSEVFILLMLVGRTSNSESKNHLFTRICAIKPSKIFLVLNNIDYLIEYCWA